MAGPVLRQCHLSSLDIDFGSEGCDVTRIAAAGSNLLVGFADGHVVLFEWSPSSRPAETPVRRQTWQLQSPPSALATKTKRGSSAVGFAGTQAGLLLGMELEKESASVLSTAHEGSGISALLCCCASGSNNLPQTSGVANILFSADVSGRIFRCCLPTSTNCATSKAAELCADVRSPVLALQLCERTGRLLISTTERIAIVDDVLLIDGHLTNATDAAAKMRWVGSKPHKGQLSATFSPNFGPDALIAARPGGRLWVADGTTGMVQTTLKFQSAVGEDKAVLGRLVALDSRTVASWTRSESNADNVGDSATTNTTITLLDLEAIAVSHEWSLSPVVDLSSCGGCLLIAHRHSVTLLLMSESPEAVMRNLLAGTASRLLRDQAFLGGCLREAQSLRQASTLSTREALQCLRPLIEAVSLAAPEGRFDQDEGTIGTNKESFFEAMASFKAFVTELEQKEEYEAGGEDGQLVLSLVVSPLANFPVAEGSGAPVSLSIVDAHHRAREAPVGEVEDAGWSFGSCGSVASKASFADNGFVTPQLLSRCRQTSAVGVENVADATELALHADVELPSEPESRGAVLVALGVTPFCGSPTTLQYLSAILQWLVVALDVLASEGSAGYMSSISFSAATAFELLCLYSVVGDESAARSGWPMFSLVPPVEVLESAPTHSELLRDELVERLRTLALVAASVVEEDVRSQPEPWVSCKSIWNSVVALAFCKHFFGSTSVAQTVLDRCLLRANGLAAQGQGWPVVVRWLRERSAVCCSSFTPPQQESWKAWDAALRHAEETAKAPDPGSGANELHACLEVALGAVGRPNALGRHLGPDCAARARRTFGVALAAFPKVLPWNVARWIQHCWQTTSGSPGEDVPKALLMSEFVQYLLRLLPTCERYSDVRSVINATLTVTLHGDFGILTETVQPQLMRARNIVADSLIDRHADLLTPAQMSQLRYPLGALLLLKRKDAGEMSEETFEQSVDVVVGILQEDGERRLAGIDCAPANSPKRCPLCSPHGRSCAQTAAMLLAKKRGATEVDSFDTALSNSHLGRRWEADYLQDHTEGPTLGFAQSTCSSKPSTCITRSDLELARELKGLCSKNARRWKYLLDAIAMTFKKFITESSDGQSAINNASAQRNLTPFQQLLVAFANLEPDDALAELAYNAIAGNVLSGIAAAAMALPLWRVAKAGSTLPTMGASGAESVKMSELGGTMFPLPPAKQPPLPPVPAPPPRRQEKNFAPTSPESPIQASTGADAESYTCTGFYQSMDRYVEISSDGISARHTDDTGELMHGVVMSNEALPLSGKIGYYFEVELVEVRPEDMPDGLTVGVTTTAPSAIQENPDTAEHIPDTWAVGYDGQLWDAKTGGLSRVDWDPRCLAPGDLVGVLVTLAEGELLVFHNGVACCPGPRGIPVDPGCNLYAVVDLLGAARAVQWRPNAQPPIGS